MLTRQESFLADVEIGLTMGLRALAIEFWSGKTRYEA
jgi:hypothetical protein